MARRSRIDAVSYRERVAAIRSARERAIESARRELAEAMAERDREIRRLRDEGLSHARIGREVGCSRETVREVLDPAMHEQNNTRRRRHWHVIRGGGAA